MFKEDLSIFIWNPLASVFAADSVLSCKVFQRFVVHRVDRSEAVNPREHAVRWSNRLYLQEKLSGIYIINELQSLFNL